jgi:hypothetical protein
VTGSLLGDFLHRRRAQRIAPTPTFEWYLMGFAHPIPQYGHTLNVTLAGSYRCIIRQDGVEVARTDWKNCFAGDQIRLTQYAPPIPRFKLLLPIIRAARVRLHRWGR